MSDELTNRARGCWSGAVLRGVIGSQERGPPELGESLKAPVHAQHLETGPGNAVVLYLGGRPQSAILSKSLKLSMPYFLHQKNGNDNTCFVQIIRFHGDLMG